MSIPCWLPTSLPNNILPEPESQLFYPSAPMKVLRLPAFEEIIDDLQHSLADERELLILTTFCLDKVPVKPETVFVA